MISTSGGLEAALEGTLSAPGAAREDSWCLLTHDRAEASRAEPESLRYARASAPVTRPTSSKSVVLKLAASTTTSTDDRRSSVLLEKHACDVV